MPKSILLTASARHVGIPARLGFADVRNHLTSKKLSEQMGTDLFAWHGYSELLVDGRWFKLSTAFNIELCDRFGVKALEFDGTDDALMHPFDRSATGTWSTSSSAAASTTCRWTRSSPTSP